MTPVIVSISGRAPMATSVAVTNGSVAHTASTSPRASAACSSGKGMATNVTCAGLRPCALNVASIARLPIAPAVCGVPIFLPLRSATDVIFDPFGTRISDTFGAACVPGAT